MARARARAANPPPTSDDLAREAREDLIRGEREAMGTPPLTIDALIEAVEDVHRRYGYVQTVAGSRPDHVASRIVPESAGGQHASASAGGVDYAGVHVPAPAFRRRDGGGGGADNSVVSSGARGAGASTGGAASAAADDEEFDAMVAALASEAEGAGVDAAELLAAAGMSPPRAQRHAPLAPPTPAAATAASTRRPRGAAGRTQVPPPLPVPSRSTKPSVPAEERYCDGSCRRSRFYSPRGLCVLDDGCVLVSDAGNHLLRLLVPGHAMIGQPTPLRALFAAKDLERTAASGDELVGDYAGEDAAGAAGAAWGGNSGGSRSHSRRSSPVASPAAREAALADRARRGISPYRRSTAASRARTFAKRSLAAPTSVNTQLGSRGAGGMGASGGNSADGDDGWAGFLRPGVGGLGIAVPRTRAGRRRGRGGGGASGVLNGVKGRQRPPPKVPDGSQEIDPADTYSYDIVRRHHPSFNDDVASEDLVSPEFRSSNGRLNGARGGERGGGGSDVGDVAAWAVARDPRDEGLIATAAATPRSPSGGEAVAGGDAGSFGRSGAARRGPAGRRGQSPPRPTSRSRRGGKPAAPPGRGANRAPRGGASGSRGGSGRAQSDPGAAPVFRPMHISPRSHGGGPPPPSAHKGVPATSAADLDAYEALLRTRGDIRELRGQAVIGHVGDVPVPSAVAFGSSGAGSAGSTGGDAAGQAQAAELQYLSGENARLRGVAAALADRVDDAVGQIVEIGGADRGRGGRWARGGAAYRK